MAARRLGSGSDGLVLYNAQDWKERVHIMDRDCAMSLHVDSSNAIQKVSSGKILYTTDGVEELDPSATSSTRISNDILGGTVANTAWDPDLGCTSSQKARSSVSKDLLEGYRDKKFRSILMPGQPFAFAGDTTLTSRRDSEGNYFVVVDRLYGNEVTWLFLSSRSQKLSMGIPRIAGELEPHVQPPYHVIYQSLLLLLLLPCGLADYHHLDNPLALFIHASSRSHPAQAGQYRLLVGYS